MKLVLGSILLLSFGYFNNKIISVPVDSHSTKDTGIIVATRLQGDNSDSLVHLDITTVIINNSKVTASCGIWTCFHQIVGATISSNDLVINPGICEKNVPLTENILPGDSIVSMLRLDSKKLYKKLLGTRFKIGVPVSRHGNLRYNFSNNKLPDDTIWSNSLTIK